VLFDHIGCGRSDHAAYDESRHGSLHGYAQDLVDILRALDLRDAILVGHSVSGMISLLAAAMEPERVSALVLIGPSPRYLNDPPDYVGGFERADIDGLLDMIDGNMLGWASFLAPAVIGAGNPEVLADELKASFCALDPYIARRFAEVTFLADNRDDLGTTVKPSLIIQVSQDAIAPVGVGQYMHRHLPGSEFAVIDGAGHAPHMTHPDQTVALMREFVSRV
jgi:sigma-B regulation protein RsbQ